MFPRVLNLPISCRRVLEIQDPISKESCVCVWGGVFMFVIFKTKQSKTAAK